MDRLTTLFLSSLLALTVLITAGCGGGGGPASGAGAAPAAAKEVTGVAATGAPIAFGAVYLKDSSDTPRELQQTTRSDGSFTFDASGLKPPFFLKTVSNNDNLYSVATDFGMTNITPLTSIVVAQAAMNDDLDTLYGTYHPAQIQSIAQKMNASDLAVQEMFAPLMADLNVSGTLVNGPFSADHTGYDALLDAIAVSVKPGAITVTLKANNLVMLNVPAGRLSSATLVTTGPVIPPGATAGSVLYTTKCAGCHGASGNSNLIGRITVSSTQNAIASNRGGMGMLTGLSAADLQAVYDHLVAASTPAPAPAPVPPAPAPAPDPAPVPAPSTPVDGAALYASKCAGCHGALATSRKQGMTIVRLQNAIGGNVGGMGYLSTLSPSEMQALVTVLNPTAPAPAPAPTPTPTPAPTPAPAPTPVPTSDGAALYAANCAGCHGSLASSSKKGISISRLQSAIANDVGGMGFLSTLTVNDVQALVTVLTPSTPTPTPTPTPAPTPPPTPTPVADGATLYNGNCSACHGALASSNKAGATASRIQSAISNNIGSMGSLASLSSVQIAAIESALATVAPAPTPTPAPAPSPPPATDGATLYGSSCAGCHGPLAQSGKAGATASRIQSAINNNVGSMGSLASLSAVQVAAIETALATVAPSPTPAPAPACGSCHAIPPANGRHSLHRSQGVSCATCHGSGYSTTAFNSATHSNGVRNLDSARTGWNASTRTCSNSCHGTERW